MSGRQIRWASVGRVAAIVAAAIAGIISLPALLGGDAPPPVPSDVGLAPPPIASMAPHAPQPPAPPPQHVTKPHHHNPPRPKLVKRTHRRRHHHQKSSPPDGASLPPVPTYVPSYAPPPRPGEFQFER